MCAAAAAAASLFPLTTPLSFRTPTTRRRLGGLFPPLQLRAPGGAVAVSGPVSVVSGWVLVGLAVARLFPRGAGFGLLLRTVVHRGLIPRLIPLAHQAGRRGAVRLRRRRGVTVLVSAHWSLVLLLFLHHHLLLLLLLMVLMMLILFLHLLLFLLLFDMAELFWGRLTDSFMTPVNVCRQRV